MTMKKAFNLFFTRGLDFKGKSSRREFWLGVLPNALIMLGLLAVLFVSLFALTKTINPFSIYMITIFSLFCLIEIVPSISLIIRRMHDIGKSGWYINVLFIPIFGLIWYFFLVTRESGYYKEA